MIDMLRLQMEKSVVDVIRSGKTSGICNPIAGSTGSWPTG